MGDSCYSKVTQICPACHIYFLDLKLPCQKQSLTFMASMFIIDLKTQFSGWISIWALFSLRESFYVQKDTKTSGIYRFHTHVLIYYGIMLSNFLPASVSFQFCGWKTGIEPFSETNFPSSLRRCYLFHATRFIKNSQCWNGVKYY